jgi:hypothetical protein
LEICICHRASEAKLADFVLLLDRAKRFFDRNTNGHDNQVVALGGLKGAAGSEDFYGIRKKIKKNCRF